MIVHFKKTITMLQTTLIFFFAFVGAYYCMNMIMITLSTFLSVVIVNLYFRGWKSRVPRPIKMVCNYVYLL